MEREERKGERLARCAWAQFLCTPLVPLLDRLWPAEKFEWRSPARLRVVK